MESANPNYILREKTMLKDRYRIDGVLGYNGLSITYDAYDTLREKHIVIKELFPAAIVRRNQNDGATVSCILFTHEKEFMRMKEHMTKEARTMVSLYPLEGISNVITFFEANQTLYLVMEYVEGESFTDYIKGMHTDRIPMKEAFRLLKPIIASLDKLHKKGVIHGKINPDLIKVYNQKTTLVGFGDPMEDAASEVFDDATARIPGYTPVEQYIDQGDFGPATDVYAIAAVLYELVTGQNVPAFYDRIGNGEADFTDPLQAPKQFNPEIMDYQNDSLMKALNIYHFDRFQTMGELAEALSEDEFADEYRFFARKPSVEMKKGYKRLVLVRNTAIIALLFLIIFFAPKAYRYAGTTGAQNFYIKLESADMATQCKMIAELPASKRISYANDYNNMPEEEGQTIHYYDKVTKRFVTHDQMDMDADLVRYIQLDYRLNNSAILTFVSEDEVRKLTINLKPDIGGQYTVEEMVHENGQDSVITVHKVK